MPTSSQPEPSPNLPESMETLAEAMRRLASAGYDGDWYPASGQLRCSTCGAHVEPAVVTVDEVVRFEGMSNPSDEAVLFALTGPCGHSGLYSAAFGPDTDPADVDVILALRPDRS